MTATDQSIRRGRKFEQVLEGARKVFLRDGFSAANVDDIAREAGVSKATLYSYFPEKRLMFSEMMRLECLRQAETAIAEINLDQPIERVLFDAACHAIELMTSDFSIRIFRICVAEAERFPELGTAFYESGPMMARAQLMFHLGQVVAEGKLQIEDLEIAANGQYLADALSVLGQGVINLAISSPTLPILVTRADDPTALMVVMPIRLRTHTPDESV